MVQILLRRTVCPASLCLCLSASLSLSVCPSPNSRKITHCWVQICGRLSSEEACTQQSQLSHKYLLLIQGTVLCNSAAQGKVFHIRSLGGYARHWHIICQTGRTGKKRVIFTSVCLQYTWTAPTRGSLPFQNSPGAVSLWPKFHPGTVTGPRLASSVEKTLIKGVFWNQRSQESLYKASQSLA